MQEDRELIILVGMQGAGKSHYCETELSGYDRISQDEGPRTFRGVVARLQQLLEEGAPRIVIDRTNPMRIQREEFATLARAYGYRVKIVYFDVPEKICRERTLEENKMNPAIVQYKSRLEEPAPEECDEIEIRKQ